MIFVRATIGEVLLRIIVMSYSHTCGLELDIFVFLLRYGAIQIFLSNGRPYKNRESSPPTNAGIFLFVT